jgi:protein-tyrosine phosphatase
MDWITDDIAIGDCLEEPPDGAAVLDLRPIPDHCRIPPHRIAEAISIIHSRIAAGKKIFVHCIGGISRSPSIVAAYLIYEHQWTVQFAFEFIRAKRPKIQPHPDQIASVRDYFEAA